MRSSTFTLDTVDDTAVHVYRWLPDDPDSVRGVVQLAHGLAEHAGRYAHVAESFTAAGYAVYGNDHRGHGRTATGEKDLGFFAPRRGWALVLDDLYRLNQRVRDAHRGAPVVLFGHSMGSFLTQQFLFTFPGAIAGAILSGSNGPVGPIGELGAAVARAERRRLGPYGRSPLLAALSFGAYNKPFEPARTEFDWLSSDPDAVDAYLADPACGFEATTQLWIDLLAGLRVIAQPERLEVVPEELPIHVVSGEQDPVGEATRGVQRLLDHYDDAGLTKVTHRFYPGRHELVNEVNRREVIDDLIAWADGVVDGRRLT